MRSVLLVDRPAIARLFDGVDESELAVVCIDGSPAERVASLQRRFRAGERAVVLYVHDAATILYPFAIEPLATAVEHQPLGSLVFVDLGLPPLGATARRFGDGRLPPDELIFSLDRVPPETLVKYCAAEARRLVAAALSSTSSDDRRREPSR